MRARTWLIVVPALLLGWAGCEIQPREEGQVPEVQPGELPEYEVEGPEMDSPAVTPPQGQPGTGPDTGTGQPAPQIP